MRTMSDELPAAVQAFQRVADRCGLTLLEDERDEDGRRSWRLFRADDPLGGVRTELFLYWRPSSRGGALGVYRYAPLAGRPGVRSRRTLVRVSHRYATFIAMSLAPPALLS